MIIFYNKIDKINLIFFILSFAKGIVDIVHTNDSKLEMLKEINNKFKKDNNQIDFD